MDARHVVVAFKSLVGNLIYGYEFLYATSLPWRKGESG